MADRTEGGSPRAEPKPTAAQIDEQQPDNRANAVDDDDDDDQPSSRGTELPRPSGSMDAAQEHGDTVQHDQAVSREDPVPTLAPLADTSQAAPLPLPDLDQLPVLQLKPRRPRPPKKGILKPPSTAQAHAARFSFRRDILQPLQSSRLAGGVVPVGSGLPSSVAVGEAMGNAAATAGGWMGSALKRLGQAAGVAAEGSSTQPHPHAGSTIAKSTIGDANGTPSIVLQNPDDGEPSQPKPPHLAASSAPDPASSATLPSAQPLQPSLSVQSLKQVRFRMQSLAVVYPINGASSSSFSSSSPTPQHTTFFNDLKVGFHPGPPLAPAEEAETRKRVDREWRSRIKMRTRSTGEKGAEGSEKGKSRSKGSDESRAWTGAELERLYRECCRTREEPGIERVKRILRENPLQPPNTLDLSRELLSHGAVEALSDLLSVDFGLKKLVLDNCGLDDESVKPLVHALLVSGSIPTISLAGNKRIRQKGWKLIAVFIRKAKFLRYLDVSDNNIDKKAAEWLVQGLVPSTVTGSPPALVDFGSAPTVDGRPELSGASTLGDESEDEEDQRSLEPLFEVAPLLKEEKDSQAGSILSLRLENCGLRGQGLEVLAQGVRMSSLKHISLRRNRINTTSAVFLALMIRDFPLATEMETTNSADSAPSTSPARPSHLHSRPFESSNSLSIRQGFSRSQVLPSAPADDALGSSDEDGRLDRPTNLEARAEREAWKADELRVRLKRQIAELPRIGSLLTLDVKANDLRGGVTYISQVLKRNRTLKVLNLSENKIDMLGLVSIAEALRYNTTLETLDLSLNPCCGPSIEGVMSLRSSMMVTPSLKRLFLNSTDLSSEGAIAFAEFLPEARSLWHLDLTSNNIDISGVLALAVSVKLNTTIRCLDINIPPNDPDFSRLSQDILETCVRNTEYAQAEADGKGKKVTIAQPIKKSTLAVNLEERKKAEELELQKKNEIKERGRTMFAAAEETRDVVREMLEVDRKAAQQGVIVAASEVVRDSLVQLQLAEAQLAEAFNATRQGEQRERAEKLLIELASLLDLAKSLYDRAPASQSQRQLSALDIPQSPAHPSEQPSSPSFSLTSTESEESVGPVPEAEESRNQDDPVATIRPNLSNNSIDLPEPSSPDSLRSPIESSARSMTLEEGEIFRKGLALGASEVPDDDEDEVRAGANGKQGNGSAIGLGMGDVSGEELKNELLEAQVPRSPRTSFSSASTPPAPQSPPDHPLTSTSSSALVDEST
ncbi:uncharacterized protein JCM15063_004071 [Sporobolomyces koalae]|uniref:uncharacterized protein n=1 Tax=Sporobolomyces koalae TaxID=500713 RepID=UPI003179BA3F